MGADGGAPSSAGHSVRVGAMGSSDIPPLPQCLSLEAILLGSQKYSPGELRRVLGYIGNASENHSFGASHYRLSPPAATEELKHYRSGVLDGFKKARERSELFGESIVKLDKYREFAGSKKRQRSDAFPSEKLNGSNLLKMSQLPRNIHDHSTQKLENKSKARMLNNRNRSSPADLKVDNKSTMISRDQMPNEKGRDVPKCINGAGVHPEERIRSLSAMGEGWDKKVKRKRSVATVANRGVDSDGKQTMHGKPTSDSKLPPIDPRNIRSNAVQSSPTRSLSPLVKAKVSRESRTGPYMMVNSSENQLPSDACEGWDSANKVQSLNVMHNRQQSANSLHSMTQWVGQRPHKISRTRRANVVSPISNYDEADDLSPGAPAFGIRKSSNGNTGSLASNDVDNTVQKSKIKQESTPSPIRLPEVAQTKDIDHEAMKEKGQSSVVASANLKNRGTIFPTKKNRNEDTGDGSWRQAKAGRGLPSPKLAILETGDKVDNVSTTRSLPNVKPVNDKTKSKTGRPPSRKLSERKAFARAAESDDDREELLAAAASARKSSYAAYSGRFWKKMEPILGSVGSQDTGFLKDQLNCAEKLEESLSRMCDADYDVLGVLMHNHKDDALSAGLDASRKLDKTSSLYQRVLSALIEEDDNEGISNGGEAISTSFQCASDDSHCGSCNYNDVEMRDRDRLESEAESIVDFQIQRHCAGDMFSCNKSIVSNNTSRNLSMSDSLYSSGRWQGDDGLSHSDVEFVSGIYQNDMGGSQHTDANVSGPPLPDCQYQLMCLDDKLVLELQSIGLYLDTIPDLADGEDEALDQDVKELKEGLKQEVGKKKSNLVKVDRALQDDRERERRYMEQLAMNQLIQMAYRKRMACRRTNGSRTMTRKVSKQVAMGFIERTLARYRKYEHTGWSCFNEPALQKVLFAPPSSEAKSGDCLGTGVQNNASSEAPKHLAKVGGSGPESGRVDIKVSLGSPPVDSHSYGFSKDEVALERGRKRELLLDDVGNGPFSRGPTSESTLLGGAKGKRSERERCHGRDTVMINSVSNGGYHSPLSNKADDTPKAKVNRKAANAAIPLNASTGGSTKAGSSNFTLDTSEELEEPIDFTKMPPPEFETLEQLGVGNDLGGTQDFASWLEDDGLQDYDSMGLEIPMDDISNLMMF